MSHRGAHGLSPDLSRGAAPRGRRAVVLGVFAFAMLALLTRAVLLQTRDHEFLSREAEARHLRTVSLPAPRGPITDRHGRALAISTPVESIWADPPVLATVAGRWPELARALDVPPESLGRRLTERAGRRFVYLLRQAGPEVVARVRALALPGVHLTREYRRFYPEGEIFAHVVGFTDVDDRGREGVELRFDRRLRGRAGAKKVIQNRLGEVVEDVEQVRPARPGAALRLSIDARLQSLAHRSLKEAVIRNRARSGSVVVLDARTGEVLAMVNQPAYNPNVVGERAGPATRNRAVTDLLEPGSTVKPFTIAAALESGAFLADASVDTAPGLVRIGAHVIRDHRPFGRLDVTGVLVRSSNVGAARIALATPPDRLWGAFAGAGFGVPTGLEFPGEAAGVLERAPAWGRIQRATLAFGYGLSVTPIQLARAYTVFATDGVLLPVTLLRREEGEDAGNGLRAPRGERVLSAPVARDLRRMLEEVVVRGTGRRAAIPGYRVAGKTGTARKASGGGYSDNRYRAMFVGMAPASRPRFVVAVILDEPGGEAYYGGEVAAPVFAQVTGAALRLFRVPPDRLRDAPRTVVLTRLAMAAPAPAPRGEGGGTP